MLDEEARSGFWRRVAAFLIDVLALLALAQIAALALFPLTGGRVQAEGLWSTSTCQSTPIAPAGIAVPPELGATGYTVCRSGTWGLELSHTLTIERRVGDQGTYAATSSTVVLDSDGRIVQGVILDALALPALVLIRAFLDALSRPTPGRLATGIKVTDRTGGLPGFGRALMHQLLVWWLPVLLSLYMLWPTVTGTILLPDPSRLVAIVLGLFGLWVIFMLVSAFLIGRRRDAPFDRWSGTYVVRRGTAAA